MTSRNDPGIAKTTESFRTGSKPARVGLSPPTWEKVVGATFSHHLVTVPSRHAISRLEVSPHTLRHTFALNYLKRSPNAITELATLMGHESLEATAVYLRPSMEDLAAGVERSALNVDR